MSAKDRSWDNAGTPDPVNVGYTTVIPGRADEPARRFEIGARSPGSGVSAPPPPQNRVALHPLLERQMEQLRRGELAGVAKRKMLLLFSNDFAIPRFPDPPFEPASDWEAGALVPAHALVEEIKQRRAPFYDDVARRLADLGIDVLDRYWVIRGVLASLSLSDVPNVIELPDLISITPEPSRERPPACTPSQAGGSDDVVDGRAAIASDRYTDLVLEQGVIALIDTFADADHKVLAGASTFRDQYDCGGATCVVPGYVEPQPHGTGSAGILVGDKSCGPEFRGMTRITTDCYEVHPNQGLSVHRAVRAIEHAFDCGARILAVVVQEASNQYASSITTASDNAFDGGAVVVAPVGNTNGTGITAAPANGHRVLGIGAYDVTNPDLGVSQSKGPTVDSRLKPDLRLPSWTESATADYLSLESFAAHTGTSGAAPYAGGAAALLRNRMIRAKKAAGDSPGIDPGAVYAMMILSGQDPYPFKNDSGAGALIMPPKGRAWWGKVAVADGDTVDVPLQVRPRSPSNLAGALWWPESGTLANDPHNTIRLYLVDPDGNVNGFSEDESSVFQRAQADPVKNGRWYLRVIGHSVSGVQEVYFAAHVTYEPLPYQPRIPHTHTMRIPPHPSVPPPVPPIPIPDPTPDPIPDPIPYPPDPGRPPGPWGPT